MKTYTNKLLALIQEFDEEFKFSDYTPEELEEYLNTLKSTNQKFKDKYFEFYDDIKSSSRKKQDW